jgi:hypothetical protein
LRSFLEIPLIINEIALGFLFVSIAESAYSAGDLGYRDEARARSHAACFRAHRLLAQVAEGDRGPLVDDLESLQSALNMLSKRQQRAFAGVLRNKAHPEEHFVLSSEKLPIRLEASPRFGPVIRNPAVRRP